MAEEFLEISPPGRDRHTPAANVGTQEEIRALVAQIAAMAPDVAQRRLAAVRARIEADPTVGTPPNLLRIALLGARVRAGADEAAQSGTETADSVLGALTEIGDHVAANWNATPKPQRYSNLPAWPPLVQAVIGEPLTAAGVRVPYIPPVLAGALETFLQSPQFQARLDVLARADRTRIAGAGMPGAVVALSALRRIAVGYNLARIDRADGMPRAWSRYRTLDVARRLVDDQSLPTAWPEVIGGTVPAAQPPGLLETWRLIDRLLSTEVSCLNQMRGAPASYYGNAGVASYCLMSNPPPRGIHCLIQKPPL